MKNRGIGQGVLMVTIDQSKLRFLKYELGLLSLKAALSTRGAGKPVYASHMKSHTRFKAKKALRGALEGVEHFYSRTNPVTEEEHIEFIERVADGLTQEIGSDLNAGRFRIGIAQKLVNMHLKYLWTAGFIDEPPHCPIDGIIRDLAALQYEWTEDDDIQNYRNAVASLRKIAETKKQSLAVWELEEFRRRDDQA